VQKRFLEKKRDHWLAFVAFDRVPRDVLCWASRVLKVDEWIVKVLQMMYQGVKTSVKINGGVSEKFEVNVGVHQGSVQGSVELMVWENPMEAKGLRVNVQPWQNQGDEECSGVGAVREIR